MAHLMRFIRRPLVVMWWLKWPALVGGGVVVASFSAGHTVFAIAGALVTCVVCAVVVMTGIKAAARAQARAHAAHKNWSLNMAALQWQAVTSLEVFTQPHAEALPALERISQQTPNDPEAWSRLAFALNMLGRSEEALAASEHALRLDSGHASAWARKAAALTNLGRTEDGLVASDHALALDPRDAMAWRTKAHALVLLGRPQEALSAYKRIWSLEADPRFPRVSAFTWYTMASDLQQLGRFSEALEAYDRVLAAHPDLVAGWLYKAACLHALKRESEMLAALRYAQERAGQVV